MNQTIWQLHFWLNQSKLAKLLIANGANVNETFTTADDERSLLHIASIEGKIAGGDENYCHWIAIMNISILILNRVWGFGSIVRGK